LDISENLCGLDAVQIYSEDRTKIPQEYGSALCGDGFIPSPFLVYRWYAMIKRRRGEAAYPSPAKAT